MSAGAHSCAIGQEQGKTVDIGSYAVRDGIASECNLMKARMEAQTGVHNYRYELYCVPTPSHSHSAPLCCLFAGFPFSQDARYGVSPLSFTPAELCVGSIFPARGS